MISLEVLLYYNASTILKGEANAKDFIVEQFCVDESLWETFVDKVQRIYDDKDDNFIDWLGRYDLSNYIVDIKEDEAIVDETGGDYVILSVPFSFDDEKAFKDFTASKNIIRLKNISWVVEADTEEDYKKVIAEYKLPTEFSINPQYALDKNGNCTDYSITTFLSDYFGVRPDSFECDGGFFLHKKFSSCGKKIGS